MMGIIPMSHLKCDHLLQYLRVETGRCSLKYLDSAGVVALSDLRLDTYSLSIFSRHLQTYFWNLSLLASTVPCKCQMLLINRNKNKKSVFETVEFISHLLGFRDFGKRGY